MNFKTFKRMGKLWKPIALLILAITVAFGGFSLAAHGARAEGEEEDEQTWQQWHMSTGSVKLEDDGSAVFTNSVNGDTAFARSDTAFAMNGLQVKLKYGFQDKKSATPDALVAPPALDEDTVDTGYNMGFRIHLSNNFYLDDQSPQICLRFMPYKDSEGNSNLATVNFWVSTGTGYDSGAWIFTDKLLADFYWDESQSNIIGLDKRDDGKFYLTVNGQSQPIHQLLSGTTYIPYQNLDTAFARFDNGKGYFMFWNNYSSAMSVNYASRVTVEEISSAAPGGFTSGDPFGYEFIEGKETDWGYNNAGQLTLFGKAPSYEYGIAETEAIHGVTGIGAKLMLNIAETNGNYFEIKYLGIEGSYAAIKFSKTSSATSVAFDVCNRGSLTTKSVALDTFNWNNSGNPALSEIVLFREKADFVITVDDNRIDGSANGLDTARAKPIAADLENIKLEFNVKGQGSLSILSFTNKLPATAPAGWVSGSDGSVQWDSDFSGNPILWSESGVFSAAFNREPSFIKSFGASVAFDKTAFNSPVNVIISSSANYYKNANGGDAIIVSFKKGSGNATDIAVKEYNKAAGNETNVATGSVNSVSWAASQEVRVQFGIAEGAWTLYVRGIKVNLSADIGAAAARVAAACTANLAYLQIHSAGDAESAVKFLGMLHYLPGPAVIEGFQSNSSLPTFGAPEIEGNIVLTYSATVGQTLKVMNKEVAVDGFKMSFEMFATPRANMGHVIIALAISNGWHSIDTGIQFAVRNSSVTPTSTTRANFGLSMTDQALGLSNTPVANYDVNFNWRGTNTIELKRSADKWELYLNGGLFNLVSGTPNENLINPIKQDGETVASTITELLDIVITRYKGNYAYLQMWNNFGAFTMAITELNLLPLNVPPALKPGIARDFTAPLNYKVRLDLNKFFAPSEGGIIDRFTVDGGAAVVDGHILEYTLTTGEKKYINIRAYDARGDFGLVRISISQDKLNLHGMGVDGEPDTDNTKGKEGCGGAGVLGKAGGAGGIGGLLLIFAALFAVIPTALKNRRKANEA